MQEALYGPSSNRAYAIRDAGHALEKIFQETKHGNYKSLKRRTASFLKRIEHDFIECGYQGDIDDVIRGLFKDGVSEGELYSTLNLIRNISEILTHLSQSYFQEWRQSH